jgi:hypothetical protein
MKTNSERIAHHRRRQVILDVTTEQGLLYVVLRNIGARSARRTTVQFDNPFHGLGGNEVCLRHSRNGFTAVYGEHLAGNEFGLGRKKEHYVSDVLGAARFPERSGANDFLD